MAGPGVMIMTRPTRITENPRIKTTMRLASRAAPFSGRVENDCGLNQRLQPGVFLGDGMQVFCQTENFRKLCSNFFPSSVRIDSGWNCTPWMGYSLWRKPMISSSWVSAVISRHAGKECRSTRSE